MQVKDLIKIPGIKPGEICFKYIFKQSLALIAQLQISAKRFYRIQAKPIRNRTHLEL